MRYEIPFNRPAFFGDELKELKKLLAQDNLHLSGNGEYTKKCELLLKEKYNFSDVLLTNSCTSALEICALLLKKHKWQKDANVILPSYNFVSTGNAFAKVGFKLKYVDINPDTMNIDEELAIKAIDSKTSAIIAVNYAGCSCDLEKLQNACNDKNIMLIEDAAQSINAKYKNKFLGSIGDLATFSFHETKNITSGGEGGALIINNAKYLEDAEIIREKGTNRSKFIREQIDKYSWVGLGGHYLMNEISAAFLYIQMQKVAEITQNRLDSWNIYYNELLPLEKTNNITLQKIPKYNQHNAHMFYCKTDNIKERDSLITRLKAQGINAVFHYVPLHNSSCGKKYGNFFGVDKYSTAEFEKLVRIPLFFSLGQENVEHIIDQIKNTVSLKNEIN
jgi:dTDP-4-amino-4,6-dideoxygalactose transaminase